MKPRGARGRRVAAVEEGVQGDGHAGAVEDAGEGGDVVLVGMHAARRQQAHQMAGAAAGLQLGDEVQQARVARRARRPSMAASMRGRSCMTTRPAPMFIWPTSELPIWPAGSPTCSSEASISAMRAVAHEAVPGRRVRQPDRVVIGRWSFRPSRRGCRARRGGADRYEPWPLYRGFGGSAVGRFAIAERTLRNR